VLVKRRSHLVSKLTDRCAFEKYGQRQINLKLSNDPAHKIDRDERRSTYIEKVVIRIERPDVEHFLPYLGHLNRERVLGIKVLRYRVPPQQAVGNVRIRQRDQINGAVVEPRKMVHLHKI